MRPFRSALQILLTVAILFTNAATAQQNNWDNADWRRDYIGTPSFRLVDDNKMAQLRQHALERKRRLQQISQNVQQQVAVVTQLQNKRKNKRQKKQALKSLTARDEQRKITLKAEYQEAKRKARRLTLEVQKAQQALPLANAELLQAQQNNTSAIAQVAAAKAEMQEARKALREIQLACRTTPTADCPKKIAESKKIAAAKQKVLAAARIVAQNSAAAVKTKAQHVSALNKEITTKQGKITAQQNQLAAIDRETLQIAQNMAARKIKIRNLNGEIAQLKSKIDIEKPKLIRLTERQQRAADVSAEATHRAREYRRRLISRVLLANNQGAIDGANAGNSDGRELSQQLGARYGTADGEQDGDQRGRLDGQQREHNAGHAAGLLEGAQRAVERGKIDGTALGRVQGNIAAAKKQGTSDGQNRAENSNAIQVGRQQGQAAGMERAIDSGREEGTKLGKKQAIAKYEDISLPTQEVKGKFFGTFSYRVPAYPGPTHDRYNTQAANNYRRKIVQMAYIDGYAFSYALNSRTSFADTIASNYSRPYNVANERAYRRALDIYYGESYTAGHTLGDSEAFDRDYPTQKAYYFAIAEKYYLENPETDSTEYTTTYSAVEAATYNTVYEEIRLEHYTTTEDATYRGNIAEQTEIFRAQRFATVEKVYREHPVLAFVKTGRQDAGINKIAANDHVYQPQEKVLHHLVVKNYGVKAAQNVVLKLNGVAFVLPAIAGQSAVTLLAAAQSKIPAQAPIGQKELYRYAIEAPLTAEATIQGRHYKNATAGLLATDKKALKVQYPLSLAGLKTAGDLIVGEDTPLTMTLQNNSKRAYHGPLEIILDVQANSQIIKQKFKNITTLSLAQSLKLDDAIALVKDPADYFQMVSFNGKIMKKGVTLGFLKAPFSIIAKEIYRERPQVPVLIVNSARSTIDLLDVIASSGGLENLSVLDLSLTQRNSQVLGQGLKNKTALVLAADSGSTVREMRSLLQKSENLALIFTDDHAQGLATFQEDEMAQDATTMDIAMAGYTDNSSSLKMLFTNPHRVTSLKDSTVAIQANLKNYRSFLPLAAKLIVAPAKLIADLSAQTNTSSYFAPATELMQNYHVLHARNMAEIMNINTAYDKSGQRGSRDTAYRRMISNDETLIVNQFKKTLGKQKKVSDDKLGITMAAINFAHTTRFAMATYKPFSRPMMSKIQDRVQGIMKIIEKNSHKPLKKKLGKKLYKKVVKAKGLHRPFFNP